MRREQLKITQHYPRFWANQICYYCGKKLIKADPKRKFAFRGWSEKTNKWEWYCWDCH